MSDAQTPTPVAWPDTLTLFALAKPIIKKWEALKLLPYLCPTGHWTIGYGSTMYPNGTRVQRTDPKIDPAWAEVMLTAHMTKDEKMLQACVTRTPSIHQAAALQCIAYNTGVGLHDGTTPDLANSHLIAALNAGDIQGAADHFLDWDKGHVMGKVVVIDGLRNRRMDERLLFLVPDKTP